MPRVVVVSNRLPVTVYPGKEPPDDVKQSSGGLVSALRQVAGEYEEMVWIGWPGACVTTDEQKYFDERLRSDSSSIKMIPVWLSQKDVEDFYNGYSNSSIWPLLHWMTPYAHVNKAWAEAYRRVNLLFADEVYKIATPKDLVWIQDYHLLLVPQLLRDRDPKPAPYISEYCEVDKLDRPDFMPAPLKSTSPSKTAEQLRPKGLTGEYTRIGLQQALERLESGLDSAGLDSSFASVTGRVSPEVIAEDQLEEAPPSPALDGEEAKLKIAFFLHTPFPPYEMLCTLPECRELLEGMLGADLIGFHTYSYLRHFRSCVIRVCGITPDMDCVDYHGQRCYLGVYPIGANVEGIQEAMKTDEFHKHLNDYTKEFDGKNLVLSVERLDYSKGLPQKLAAIEMYLEKAEELAKEAATASFAAEDADAASSVDPTNDQLQTVIKGARKRVVKKGSGPRDTLTIGQHFRTWGAGFSKGFRDNVKVEDKVDHKNTIFLFVAVPSRQEVNEYQKIETEVHQTIGKINGRFSTALRQPVIYIHRGIQLPELVALYARADVCLVTPLIDGMNLVAKEYLVAKEASAEQPHIVPGALVLSELAGAAQELFSAIIVNPYDPDDVAGAIHIAIEATRGAHMNAEERWALTATMREQVVLHNAGAWAKHILHELRQPRTANLGRPISVVPVLPSSAFHDFAEKAPGTKALFLDYDGTLRDFEVSPEDAVPTEELRLLFGKLNDREDLEVFIMSGRDRGFLQANFADFPAFTLVAEHGHAICSKMQREWKDIEKVSIAWMEKIWPIMTQFRDCTPGSRIEQKEASLIWHYRGCEEDDFGYFKAKELIHQLCCSLGNLPCRVSISDENKKVFVASLEVKKGPVMLSAIKGKTGDPYSKILVAGDDLSDESMFEDAPLDTYTVKVGPGETRARYKLDNAADLRHFLFRVADAVGSAHAGDSDGPVRFVSADELGKSQAKHQCNSLDADDPLAALGESEV